MRIEKISKNQLKEFSQLKQKKFRKQRKQVLVEGKRAISQLKENSITLDYLLLNESNYSEFKEIKAKELLLLEEWQFQKISSTKTPQSAVAIVSISEHKILEKGFLLYLDDISEPGNLGTIFRTASAAGVTGIFLSPDCCDIYNPKVVRSSLGTVFTMPSQIITKEQLLSNSLFLIASVMDGETNLYDISKIPENSILVMGSEAIGIDKDIVKKADMRISIPMVNKMESLNVAMAMGIITFQLINLSK